MAAAKTLKYQDLRVQSGIEHLASNVTTDS